MEYVRFSRLKKAAHLLRQTNSDILDIALDCGYEAHESFSRAFKNFHGVVPKMAKTDGNEFKNFSKANIGIEVNTNNILNYRIESKEVIKVLAFLRKFNIFFF